MKSNQAGPSVTVLIDTYNHEQFIEKAIKSVLCQSYNLDKAQIIVVDDGSVDNTAKIVERFLPEIEYYYKNNEGQASAFNFALEKAKADIIVFLDGDDWWHPDKLKIVTETFEANSEIGAIGHGIFEVCENEDMIRCLSPVEDTPFFLNNLDAAKQFLGLKCFLGTSRFAVRRKVLDEILPVPKQIFFGDEYLFTLAPVIMPVKVLKTPLTYYRLHESNLYQNKNLNKKQQSHRHQVFDYLYKNLFNTLQSKGVSKPIINLIMKPIWIEINRLKLALYGGRHKETFKVELSSIDTDYERLSWFHSILKLLVLFLALILPPRLFYRLRELYTKKHIVKYVFMNRKSTPKFTIKKEKHQ